VGSLDGYVHALDADDGDRQWRTETNGVVNSSPAVTGAVDGDSAEPGQLYVGSVDGRLYALSADDGDESWHFDTAGKVYSSPAVANGTVYVGSEDGNVYAVTGRTTPTTTGGEGGGGLLPTPGFGVFGTLVALGLGGWGLLRRNGSDDAEK